MTSWAERRRLLIDLETYSSVDITKAGAFKYVEAPDFEILLLAYAWNDGPVRVLDCGCGFGALGLALLRQRRDDTAGWLYILR